jgi:hypothetical protein
MFLQEPLVNKFSKKRTTDSEIITGTLWVRIVRHSAEPKKW